MVILLSFLSLLLYPLECVNNFSVTTTFHTRCKQNSNMRLLFCYTEKFINRYMAEGTLCNCLEATSRLQSRLQYLSILWVRIHMHTWLSRHYTKYVHHLHQLMPLQLQHYFIMITYTNIFRCFSNVICYNAAALPC